MQRSIIGKKPGLRADRRLGVRLGVAAWLAGALLAAGALAHQQVPQTAPAPQLSTPAPPRAPEVDTEKEAYAKLPPCKLSDDGTRLAEEPCRTAKALDPMPRRPVPQAIERVSPAESDPRDAARPPAATTPVPGASLRGTPLPATPSRVLPTPPRPLTPATPSRIDPVARPGAPVPTAGCDAGGCYGPNGQRYNNGPGNTVVSPSGRLCSRNGAFIQC
ncbi:hypothetical protein ASF61_18390 [Duganella sp. Leaf126]|uniref:hypothetical protein n=1 Tax=Duganella sp. Leaf126 TaxID=1736266 RepID=UPI0006FDCFC6|nr:hypothetical protein [Duganella sp. Leaf126]KQQ46366.1 hypothetical protein ASF61_18390 [Duganella sp. Leaf126]